MKRTIALMMLAVVLAAVLAMSMVGCIQGGGIAWSPRARMLAARDTFNATVNSLAAFREAGAFTKTEAENVTMIITLGEQTLDRWEAAIELGQSNEGFMRDMNFIVRELVAKRIAAERKAKDGT